MKKVFVVLIAIIGLASAVLLKMNNTAEVKSHFGHGISSQESVKVLETRPKTLAPRGATYTMEAVVNKDHLKDIPTTHQFEREYLGQTERELAEALKTSKAVLAQAKLITKANQGSLSAGEEALLVQEMRRQGVLSHYLVDVRIKKFKEKYL